MIEAYFSISSTWKPPIIEFEVSNCVFNMAIRCIQGYWLQSVFLIRERSTPFPLALSLSLKLPEQSNSRVSRVVKMFATKLTNSCVSYEFFSIKPHVHPTYDWNGIIKSTLEEDAGDRDDVTCMATIPFDVKVEVFFLAKEDGIIAGRALAEMIFHEVDPTLKVEWSKNDGDFVHKGLQLGKVHGQAHNIVVAERVALSFNAKAILCCSIKFSGCFLEDC